MRVGTNTIRFNVRNPDPVTRARWSAGTLPQTNVVQHTEIILGRPPFRQTGIASEILPRVSLRTRAQPPARWLSWRVTTFDDLGNWAGQGVQYSDWEQLPMLPRTNSVWKVVAEGTEYISAGLLDRLLDNGAVALTTDPRVLAYGVQKLLERC